MTEENPLVFTTMGNIPAEGLEYFHEWNVANRDPLEIHFTDGYMLNGEIVKKSVHVYSEANLKASADQPSINL
jgi:hypothetical protein